MLAKHISPFTPRIAETWDTWLRYPGDRKVFVLLPNGEWRLRYDLGLDMQGIPKETGCLISGRINGGDGHLPSWLANVIGALKHEGSPVVVTSRMSDVAKELVESFLPKGDVVVGGKRGVSTLDGMFVEQGLCLFRADNMETTVLDDVLPFVQDGVKSKWERTLFIAQPIHTVRQNLTTLSEGPGRFRCITAEDQLSFISDRNMGFRTGVWLHRIPSDDTTKAPVYRAYNVDKSSYQNSLIAHYTAMGFK